MLAGGRAFPLRTGAKIIAGETVARTPLKDASRVERCGTGILACVAFVFSSHERSCRRQRRRKPTQARMPVSQRTNRAASFHTDPCPPGGPRTLVSAASTLVSMLFGPHPKYR